jgi:transcriptional regulator with GAF, ATPase, and Fis domain
MVPAIHSIRVVGLGSSPEEVAACALLLQRHNLVPVRHVPGNSPHEDTALVVLVERVNVEVLETVSQMSCGGSTLVIVLRPDELFTAEEEWMLLHAGAGDVLSGHSLESLGRECAVRIHESTAIDQRVRELTTQGRCVGHSLAWKQVLRQEVQAARGAALPVLLQGQTGTGKELIARLIHELVGEGRGPFVTVDCTTIVRELSGSELFGHVRGAFTGAHAERAGAFAAADGGTLFLDEIGELPLGLQPELLRVLQEGTYKAVGSNIWQRTTFRLISATHRDLHSQAFRSDLLFRIAGWRIALPALADRMEDIQPLAEHFLKECLPHSPLPEISPNVWGFLHTRQYAGNVRELRNVCRRLALRSGGTGLITLGAVAAEDRPTTVPTAPSWKQDLARISELALTQGVTLKDFAEEARDQLVQSTVRAEGGSLQRAARRLGVTDRALQLRAAGKRQDRPSE